MESNQPLNRILENHKGISLVLLRVIVIYLAIFIVSNLANLGNSYVNKLAFFGFTLPLILWIILNFTGLFKKNEFEEITQLGKKLLKWGVGFFVVSIGLSLIGSGFSSSGNSLQSTMDSISAQLSFMIISSLFLKGAFWLILSGILFFFTKIIIGLIKK